MHSGLLVRGMWGGGCDWHKYENIVRYVRGMCRDGVCDLHKYERIVRLTRVH